jgi:hypothetical protein
MADLGRPTDWPQLILKLTRSRCSSLDGFFQENGPILWQSGTYEPQANPFSWTNLTNMVWVDQPIGQPIANYSYTAYTDDLQELVLGRRLQMVQPMSPTKSMSDASLQGSGRTLWTLSI